MNQKAQPPTKRISNIRYREAVYLSGTMETNTKAGHRNCVLTLDKGGVIVDIPAEPTRNAPAFSTLVPFSNIKQIEFDVETESV